MVVPLQLATYSPPPTESGAAVPNADSSSTTHTHSTPSIRAAALQDSSLLDTATSVPPGHPTSVFPGHSTSRTRFLGQRQLGAPVDGVGLSPHIGLPGVRAGLPPPTRLLFATESATDFGTTGPDVHVGDAAVAPSMRQKVFASLMCSVKSPKKGPGGRRCGVASPPRVRLPISSEANQRHRTQ